MIQKFKATILTKHDNAENAWLLDWLWLQSATHVVTPPSTFSWWSTFLGNSLTIYLPVPPGFTPIPDWCELLPGDDKRYVFYDWWNNVSWRGGSKDKISAVQQCRNYVKVCTCPGTTRPCTTRNCLLKSKKKELENLFPEIRNPTQRSTPPRRISKT